MELPAYDVKQMVPPLRAIFWGGMLCVLDLWFSSTTNGVGFRFDILNDFVGMLLITWGVFRLSKLWVNQQYATVMTLVQIAAIIGCVDALQAHFIYDAPPVVSAVLSLAGLAQLAATILFCFAMQWLSTAARLTNAASSWRTTTILFVVIYAIPGGLVYAGSLIALVADTHFNLDIGPAALLLIPVFLVPVIHLFVSTSRMQREAESAAAARSQTDATGSSGTGD
jgi:hypothetical protein